MDLSAEKIVKNYEQLKGSRERFTSLYDKLHRFFYVEGTNVYPDENNADLPALLDSTSLDCADVLAAGLSNYLTPESSNWVYLEHPNRELREDNDVKVWLQEVADEVLLTLSQSNFYNQMPIFTRLPAFTERPR